MNTYYLYKERFGHKRAGVYIREYRPKMDWTLTIVALAIGAIIVALIMVGVI